MLVSRILGLAASLLLISSPALGQQQVGGHTVYTDAKPDIWAGSITSGPLTHRATGVIFPDTSGDFKRVRIMAVEDATDVMVHYQWARSAGAIDVSAYLFRPGKLPEHTLKGSIESLSYGRFQQIVCSDGPFDVAATPKLRLFKGTYKTGVGPQAVMDYLYFAQLGQWTAKVRATLPSPQDPAEEQRIDAFVRALPWAQILRANGTCSGAACDGQRVMPFNHHMGEMFLTQVLNSGQGKKVEGGTMGPAYSRTVGDKIWTASPLTDAFAELFNSGFGALNAGAPLYSLAWKDKKKSGLVRFFSGKPDESMFNRNVDGLTAKPEQSAFVSADTASAYAPD